MKNKAKLFALIPLIFFSVSGGPYGLEEIISSIGPLNTLLVIVILPVVWTIPETMIVAELSSTYPVQGGYYRWVQMGLGKFWGFMEGWWSVLFTLIDLSLYPILFTTYLKIIFPDLQFWSVYIIQLLMIWSCALINILGIKTVGNFLVFFKTFILVLFLFFIFLGFSHSSFDISYIFKSTNELKTSNLLFGISLAFWNFIGWDSGSTVLGEIDNPSRNYHKAVFITIPIVVFFYFFPVLIGLGIHHDWQSWKFGEFTYIANSIGQPFLGLLLAIGGMIMCLGLFNSLLLSSSRIISIMAQDKFFPKIFIKNHVTFNTPFIAIIFACLIYSFLVLFSFKNLIVYDVFLYIIALFLEALALLFLRNKNPGLHTKFKIPFGNFGLYLSFGLVTLMVLLMFFINCFGVHATLTQSLLSLGLILSGIPLYMLFNNHQS